MTPRASRTETLLGAALLALALGASAAPGGKQKTNAGQLPPELRGAKIYRLPEGDRTVRNLENFVAYRRLAYQDIDFNRLLLNVYLSLQPVDRDVTVRSIHFQNVRVGGLPVHLAPLTTPFKASKEQAVDLPGPIQCSIVFADLEAIAPLRRLVEQENIRITGESFIEVKLNTLQKIFLRTRNLVVPVSFDEEVPLEMFAGSPLMKLAATKVLDALSDPSTSAAVELAKERVARLAREQQLSSLARRSVYLLYCQYALRDPKTGNSEKFTQSGTGFLVSRDGKLLTAKRVVQPWKFDPGVSYLINRYHLEVDSDSYRLAAWRAESQVLAPGGELDFQNALDSKSQSLQIVQTSADHFEKKNYHDPDSGNSATVEVEPAGENDWAILRLRGDNLQPLALADKSDSAREDSPATLLAYPYGLSQSIADPQLISVQASPQASHLTINHTLAPGEFGAPLVNSEGKVVGLASGADRCIPLKSMRLPIP